MNKNQEYHDAVDCTKSLLQAIQEAGGSIGAVDLDMSLKDFIVSVGGPNKVWFQKAGQPPVPYATMQRDNFIGAVSIAIDAETEKGRANSGFVDGLRLVKRKVEGGQTLVLRD